MKDEIDAAFEEIKLKPFNNDWKAFEQFCSSMSEPIGEWEGYFINDVNGYVGAGVEQWLIYEFSSVHLHAEQILASNKLNIDLYNELLYVTLCREYIGNWAVVKPYWLEKGLCFRDYCSNQSDVIYERSFNLLDEGFINPIAQIDDFNFQHIDIVKEIVKVDSCLCEYQLVKVNADIPFLNATTDFSDIVPKNKTSKFVETANHIHKKALNKFRLASLIFTVSQVRQHVLENVPNDEKQIMQLKLELLKKEQKIALLEARTLMDQMTQVVSRFYLSSHKSKTTTHNRKQLEAENYRLVSKAIKRFLSSKPKAKTNSDLKAQLREANSFIRKSTGIDSDTTVRKYKKQWLEENGLN
ncbi:hypothetical protein [Catenovulum agarivorans]|uniref:hypothetical protein n=1 Tax=Catenovulum agarivorans TaxID=1172192 RepID=UPI0002E7C328|nr:hypothetical protein [Catenovulum agarivorans]